MKSIIKAKLLVEEDPYYLLPIANAELKVVDLNEGGQVKNDGENSPEIAVANQSTWMDKEQHEVAEPIASDPVYEQEQVDFDALKEAAYQEAYARGLSDVKEKYDHLLSKANSIFDSVKDAIPDYVKKNELIIASIVYEVVSKIIGATLADKEKSLEVVKTTISNLEGSLIQQVYISQRDFESLKELREKSLLDNVGGELQSILELIKPDTNIKLGGCKVALKESFMDASVDSQLQVLMSNLVKKANESIY